MQTILLTGGTGYLGSNLAKRLVSGGYRVAVLTRKSSSLSRIREILPSLVIFSLEDGLDQPFQNLEHVDAVVHTATCYGRNGESLAAIVEANVLFPLRLLNLAQANGVELFVNADSFFSSESTYDYLAAYSMSKRHFAEWGRKYVEQRILKFLNVRLEHVFGPNDDESKFSHWIVRQCLDGNETIKLTQGLQRRDFVFIDDVVSAFDVLLRNSKSLDLGWTSVGLGTGNAVTIKYFVELVHRLTSSKAKLLFGALPQRHGEIMHSCADNSMLVKLGWTPAFDLESAIRRTIESEIRC